MKYYYIGQTVYHWNHGKGKVTEIFENNENIHVEFGVEKYVVVFTLNGYLHDHEETFPTLSQTPYSLVDGGFTREPLLEKGQLIYIDGQYGIWMTFFSHYGSDGHLYALKTQKSESWNTINVTGIYSLTNPLENAVRKD